MRLDFPFFFIAFVTLISATAAMRLRNIVHCALCAALAFTGLAMAYLRLNAEFVALAQFFVYVGAVVVLLVFAIMLTRGADGVQTSVLAPPFAWAGILVACLLGGVLVVGMAKGFAHHATNGPVPAVSVRAIGQQLLARQVVALEATGLLLTAAMIGAVVIALREEQPKRNAAAPKVAAKPKARAELETVPQP